MGNMRNNYLELISHCVKPDLRNLFLKTTVISVWKLLCSSSHN